MTHNTKGIVLRTVKYGETSVITAVYTELFGLQSYIVKGVRQSSAKKTGKAMYFQPGAILQMEVYHNDLKNLQFIKDYQWGYIYASLFSDVVKNAAAAYIIELLQQTLKQPEANPELFYLIEDSLLQLDKGNETLAANMPLYFSLHLAAELGFQLQGVYDAKQNTILDLQEGSFISSIPEHMHYISGEDAKITSQVNSIMFYNDLENFSLNRSTRRRLLDTYVQYFMLHTEGFSELKSLKVLSAVLG